MNNTLVKYQTTAPDWLYHPANLNMDLLPVIQKELIKLSVVTKKNNLVPYTSTFVEIKNLKLIELMCPVLIQELKKLELYDTFGLIAIISVDCSKEFPPHVDVGDDIAMNIPLINCEGTYTVWYDAKIIDQELPSYAIGSEIVKIARICDPRTAVEIGRCDSTIPHWINVNVPHRPETHHDKLRMAASIRFLPSPLNDGELWSNLILNNG